MKTTKIRHLIDPNEKRLDEIVDEFEKEGYEVTQVRSCCAKDGLSTSFVTIVFQKERQ